MSEQQTWYIYQNEQQLGPFSIQQVNQLRTNNMIAKEAFLFKAGWQDWRPLAECLEELGEETFKAGNDNRRTNRASVSGRVIVHNDSDLDFARGVNISEAGIFIETNRDFFKLGEKLKITIQIKEFNQSYNARAKVVRHNSDSAWMIGYGLVFEKADPRMIAEVKRICLDAQDDLPISKIG